MLHEFPNPVSIATVPAERTFADPTSLEPPMYLDGVLAELDATAESLGFIDAAYRIRTDRAVSAHKYAPFKKESNLYDFYSLEFMGKLLCYAKAKFSVPDDTPRLAGLCLNFYETLLLPDADPLPRGHVLYVPVMAVKSIEPIPY